MKRLRFQIKGVAPLLMHNGRTANPMDKYAKAMKEISGKRKKTDADYEKLAEIELEAGLYLDSDGKVVFPALNIEQAIIQGAKKNKLGTQFLKSIVVDADMPVKNGRQYTKEQVMTQEKFKDQALVRVNRSSRVLRTRPRFDVWNGEFDVLYRPDLVNQDQVATAVEIAGKEVGFGDWRPRFGRFEVEEVLIVE